MWLGYLADFLVTAVALVLLYWIGYRRGLYVARTERLETLRKNVHKRAAAAKADADVLDRVVPPRSRRARIAGTSRRDLNS